MSTPLGSPVSYEQAIARWARLIADAQDRARKGMNMVRQSRDLIAARGPICRRCWSPMWFPQNMSADGDRLVHTLCLDEIHLDEVA